MSVISAPGTEWNFCDAPPALPEIPGAVDPDEAAMEEVRMELSEITDKMREIRQAREERREQGVIGQPLVCLREREVETRLRARISELARVIRCLVHLRYWTEYEQQTIDGYYNPATGAPSRLAGRDFVQRTRQLSQEMFTAAQTLRDERFEEFRDTVTRITNILQSFRTATPTVPRRPIYSMEWQRVHLVPAVHMRYARFANRMRNLQALQIPIMNGFNRTNSDLPSHRSVGEYVRQFANLGRIFTAFPVTSTPVTTLPNTVPPDSVLPASVPPVSVPPASAPSSTVPPASAAPVSTQTATVPPSNP